MLHKRVFGECAFSDTGLKRVRLKSPRRRPRPKYWGPSCCLYSFLLMYIMMFSSCRLYSFLLMYVMILSSCYLSSFLLMYVMMFSSCHLYSFLLVYIMTQCGWSAWLLGACVWLRWRQPAAVTHYAPCPPRALASTALCCTLLMMMKWCLMSSDVGWHIRDKLRPMPKHDSINLYVHGNQKAR